MGSFKLKLVVYFLLLSLLPLAAAFWGFSTVASKSETRRVDARLQASLRATLAAYQERLDGAERTAETLARDTTFQRALQERDRATLRRMLSDSPNVYVWTTSGFHAGDRQAYAASREVTLYGRGGVASGVIVYVPYDWRLVTSLRSRSGLAPDDSLALLEKRRVITSAPALLSGRVSARDGRTATVTVGDERFRAVTTNPLARNPQVRFAVLTPQAEIDSANAGARNRLLLGLLATLLLFAGVAYVEGRSIVRTLRRLARAAHGIASGSFEERVPVHGRDEFAVLGRAFNEMADQLQQRVEELEDERARLRDTVARFGEALGATHEPELLLRVIVETALEATQANGAALIVEAGEVVAAGRREGAARLELPLVAGRTSFGTLCLFADAFDAEQTMTANSLASQGVIALENARLHRIVERQALVDGLTGLANRRQAEDALTAEVARADRFGGEFSLVLADLDDFKRINDVHGHQAGDAVLRDFAHVLRETVRDADVAARWGGEEFVILLPGTDADGAAQLAERVRTTIGRRTILASDGSPVRITCSFGVASHGAAGTEQELVAAADEALYRAKREGKNRVVSAGGVSSFR